LIREIVAERRPPTLVASSIELNINGPVDLDWHKVLSLNVGDVSYLGYRTRESSRPARVWTLMTKAGDNHEIEFNADRANLEANGG
jgi:hypothetical protein